jgi:hypothetical protein
MLTVAWASSRKFRRPTGTSKFRLLFPAYANNIRGRHYISSVVLDCYFERFDIGSCGDFGPPSAPAKSAERNGG